jgi:hypothetical protein
VSHLNNDQTIPKRIETGTSEGDILGFTEELFSGWLEIYKDARLYLYYIISRCKNEGNTQTLITRWVNEGYDVRIVKPSPVMKHILGKFGYVESFENLSRHYDEEVEVWRSPFHQFSGAPCIADGRSRKKFRQIVSEISGIPDEDPNAAI